MARPKRVIDWNVVEQRMEAGSPAKEIAATLRIEINTFYDRFKKEYGCGFADYADDFHSAGKSNIRHIQYLKALEGNIPMLQILGKHWLGQNDKDTGDFQCTVKIVDARSNSATQIPVSTLPGSSMDSDTARS
jgi:hypothetical protein